jgi:hypothetical protein
MATARHSSTSLFGFLRKEKDKEGRWREIQYMEEHSRTSLLQKTIL